MTPATNAWPRTDAQRESLEGMLFRPSGAYTVTNTYATNQYGEVGLAVGTTPLIQTTEVAAPRSAEADAVAADNEARKVTLDDGASTNYTASSFSTRTCGTRPVPCLLNADVTPAYVSTTAPVRVRSTGGLHGPMSSSTTASTCGATSPRPRWWALTSDGSPVAFTNTRTAAPDSTRDSAVPTSRSPRSTC